MVRCCVEGCKSEAIIKTRDDRIGEKTERKGSSKLCLEHAIMFHVHNMVPKVEYKVLDDHKDPFPDGPATKFYEHQMRKVNLVTTSKGTDIWRCEKRGCSYEVERRMGPTGIPKTCLVPPLLPEVPFVSKLRESTGDKEQKFFLESFNYRISCHGHESANKLGARGVPQDKLLEYLISDNFGISYLVKTLNKRQHIQDKDPRQTIIVIEQMPVLTPFEQDDFELVDETDPTNRSREPFKIFHRKSTGKYLTSVWGERAESDTKEELIEMIKAISEGR